MTGELVPLDSTAGPLTWLPRPIQKAWFGDKDNLSTREAYMRDGWHWISWCRDHGVDPLRATPGAVRAWIDDQRAGTWFPPLVRRRGAGADAEATIARRVSSVSRLYVVLRGEGATLVDPLANVTRPKNPEPEDRRILGLDASTAARLLLAADRHSPRVAALVWLLVATGLRVSEALGADIDALGEQRGHRTITVMGKGRKPRLVTIPPDPWHRIVTYLDGRAEGPIFLANRTGHRWSRIDVWKVLHRLGYRSSVDPGMHPHKLRHTAMTLALDSGAALDQVADMAGHSSPKTTMRYRAARNRVENPASYGVMSEIHKAPVGNGDEQHREETS